MRNTLFLTALLCLVAGMMATAQTTPNKLKTSLYKSANEIEAKLIAWRRDIHQNPELSNREFKTAEKIAAHLRTLGIEVQTGVAVTGVVGILKGGKPGPVIGLRADMDALPVIERTQLPFASNVMAEYGGQQVGVMHACGHDTHVAILMAVAEVLAKHQKELKGTIKFIFQPSEEGAPDGEEGGASLMVKQGVLKNPDVEVVFGLHISAQTPVGTLEYKPGGIMAAADKLYITVNGKQTHGSTPWTGVDPIATSVQIVNSLQYIISRQTELTNEAAVITIGTIHGGVRNNIIPEKVEMTGTIRTLDRDMQLKIHEKIKQTAKNVADNMGATVDVKIVEAAPVTFNNVALMAQMLPSLQEAAGKEQVNLMKAITGAEDFSYFQLQVPGIYFFLGGMAKGKKAGDVAPHHTPDFYIDESGLTLGVKAFCSLVVDYADQKK